MKLYIVRHGETDYNREGRLQGQSDTELNETGRAQAEALRDSLIKRGLSFDCVISSPLRRAKRTAMIVSGARETDIITDDRLMEIGYGPYEGMLISELPEDIYTALRHPESHETPEGVEPLAEIMERTGSFIRDVHSMARGENVLVLTHGSAMRVLLSHLRGNSYERMKEVKIDNCRLFEAEYINGGWEPRDSRP